jgi:hypothetical protein
MISFIKSFFGPKKEKSSTRLQCEKCSNLAIYRHRPLSGPFEEHRSFLCGACIPRNCSCNTFLIRQEKFNSIMKGKYPELIMSNGFVDMNALGPYLELSYLEMELPCLEYEFSENGWKK